MKRDLGKVVGKEKKDYWGKDMSLEFLSVKLNII
jgi:hypothetical protein